MIFPTKRPASTRSSASNAQGSLTQEAADMAQAERRSVHDYGGGYLVDTSSWRTWHPLRPPSAQSADAAAAGPVSPLEAPAPAFQTSSRGARTTLGTWETSSEPDSSAADRFSATPLATQLSPAPGRPGDRAKGAGLAPG